MKGRTSAGFEIGSLSEAGRARRASFFEAPGRGIRSKENAVEIKPHAFAPRNSRNMMPPVQWQVLPAGRELASRRVGKGQVRRAILQVAQPNVLGSRAATENLFIEPAIKACP